MKLADLIADTGLRMAALDGLLDSGQIDTQTLEAAAREGIAKVREQDDFWYEEEGERRLDVDDHREDILAIVLLALGELELDPEPLSTLTSLDFDGGNEIYMWFEATTAELLGLEDWELDTGGESDLYNVQSFAGIDALPALTSFSLDAYGYASEPRDPAPLLALTALQELDLAGVHLSNDAALLELPALTKLMGTRNIADDVLEQLKKRGVAVS